MPEFDLCGSPRGGALFRMLVERLTVGTHAVRGTYDGKASRPEGCRRRAPSTTAGERAMKMTTDPPEIDG